MLQRLSDAQRDLAYRDRGPHGGRAFLLIHGWGCDHSFFDAQFDALAGTARVVAPDLSGFGASTAINHDYSVARFAEDIVWLSHSLDLVRPVIIGHSMGGLIALETACRSDLAAGVMMIDSMVFPSLELAEAIGQIASGLNGSQRDVALATCVSLLVEPGDGERVARKLEKALQSVSPDVLSASFVEHLVRYDPAVAASTCAVPIAYVGARVPLGNTAAFKTHRPNLQVGQTIGSGHFSPMIVPEQINAMITDFARSLPQ